MTIQRMLASAGLVFLFGCATAAGPLPKAQVFNDGTWIEYSAAGNPVRFTDTSGKVFVNDVSLSMEQIFDDGTRIEYGAAGTPVRFTDTSGKIFAKPSQTLSSSL
jgi:phage baseplate assembly protein gpV